MRLSSLRFHNFLFSGHLSDSTSQSNLLLLVLNFCKHPLRAYRKGALMKEPIPSNRSFRSGSWDLRREERRKAERTINFPDRRISDRREDMSAWLNLENSELTGQRT
jgi:hypothetical protein